MPIGLLRVNSRVGQPSANASLNCGPSTEAITDPSLPAKSLGPLSAAGQGGSAADVIATTAGTCLTEVGLCTEAARKETAYRPGFISNDCSLGGSCSIGGSSSHGGGSSHCGTSSHGGSSSHGGGSSHGGSCSIGGFSQGGSCSIGGSCANGSAYPADVIGTAGIPVLGTELAGAHVLTRRTYDLVAAGSDCLEASNRDTGGSIPHQASAAKFEGEPVAYSLEPPPPVGTSSPRLLPATSPRSRGAEYRSFRRSIPRPLNSASRPGAYHPTTPIVAEADADAAYAATLCASPAVQGGNDPSCVLYASQDCTVSPAPRGRVGAVVALLDSIAMANSPGQTTPAAQPDSASRRSGPVRSAASQEQPLPPSSFSRIPRPPALQISDPAVNQAGAEPPMWVSQQSVQTPVSGRNTVSTASESAAVRSRSAAIAKSSAGFTSTTSPSPGMAGTRALRSLGGTPASTPKASSRGVKKGSSPVSTSSRPHTRSVGTFQPKEPPPRRTGMPQTAASMPSPSTPSPATAQARPRFNPYCSSSRGTSAQSAAASVSVVRASAAPAVPAAASGSAARYTRGVDTLSSPEPPRGSAQMRSAATASLAAKAAARQPQSAGLMTSNGAGVRAGAKQGPVSSITPAPSASESPPRGGAAQRKASTATDPGAPSQRGKSTATTPQPPATRGRATTISASPGTDTRGLPPRPACRYSIESTCSDLPPALQYGPSPRLPDGTPQRPLRRPPYHSSPPPVIAHSPANTLPLLRSPCCPSPGSFSPGQPQGTPIRHDDDMMPMASPDPAALTGCAGLPGPRRLARGTPVPKLDLRGNGWPTHGSNSRHGTDRDQQDTAPMGAFLPSEAGNGESDNVRTGRPMESDGDSGDESDTGFGLPAWAWRSVAVLLSTDASAGQDRNQPPQPRCRRQLVAEDQQLRSSCDKEEDLSLVPLRRLSGTPRQRRPPPIITEGPLFSAATDAYVSPAFAVNGVTGPGSVRTPLLRPSPDSCASLLLRCQAARERYPSRRTTRGEDTAAQRRGAGSPASVHSSDSDEPAVPLPVPCGDADGPILDVGAGAPLEALSARNIDAMVMESLRCSGKPFAGIWSAPSPPTASLDAGSSLCAEGVEDSVVGAYTLPAVGTDKAFLTLGAEFMVETDVVELGMAACDVPLQEVSPALPLPSSPAHSDDLQTRCDQEGSQSEELTQPPASVPCASPPLSPGRMQQRRPGHRSGSLHKRPSLDRLGGSLGKSLESLRTSAATPFSALSAGPHNDVQLRTSRAVSLTAAAAASSACAAAATPEPCGPKEDQDQGLLQLAAGPTTTQLGDPRDGSMAVRLSGLSGEPAAAMALELLSRSEPVAMPPLTATRDGCADVGLSRTLELSATATVAVAAAAGALGAASTLPSLMYGGFVALSSTAAGVSHAVAAAVAAAVCSVVWGSTACEAAALTSPSTVALAAMSVIVVAGVAAAAALTSGTATTRPQTTRRSPVPLGLGTAAGASVPADTVARPPAQQEVVRSDEVVRSAVKAPEVVDVAGNTGPDLAERPLEPEPPAQLQSGAMGGGPESILRGSEGTEGSAPCASNAIAIEHDAVAERKEEPQGTLSEAGEQRRRRVLGIATAAAGACAEAVLAMRAAGHRPAALRRVARAYGVIAGMQLAAEAGAGRALPATDAEWFHLHSLVRQSLSLPLARAAADSASSLAATAQAQVGTQAPVATLLQLHGALQLVADAAARDSAAAVAAACAEDVACLALALHQRATILAAVTLQAEVDSATSQLAAKGEQAALDWLARQLHELGQVRTAAEVVDAAAVAHAVLAGVEGPVDGQVLAASSALQAPVHARQELLAALAVVAEHGAAAAACAAEGEEEAQQQFLCMREGTARVCFAAEAEAAAEAISATAGKDQALEELVAYRHQQLVAVSAVAAHIAALDARGGAAAREAVKNWLQARNLRLQWVASAAEVDSAVAVLAQAAADTGYLMMVQQRKAVLAAAAAHADAAQALWASAAEERAVEHALLDRGALMGLCLALEAAEAAGATPGLLAEHDALRALAADLASNLTAHAYGLAHSAAVASRAIAAEGCALELLACRRREELAALAMEAAEDAVAATRAAGCEEAAQQQLAEVLGALTHTCFTAETEGAADAVRDVDSSQQLYYVAGVAEADSAIAVCAALAEADAPLFLLLEAEGQLLQAGAVTGPAHREPVKDWYAVMIMQAQQQRLRMRASFLGASLAVMATAARAWASVGGSVPTGGSTLVRGGASIGGSASVGGSAPTGGSTMVRGGASTGGSASVRGSASAGGARQDKAPGAMRRTTTFGDLTTPEPSATCTPMRLSRAGGRSDGGAELLPAPAAAESPVLRSPDLVRSFPLEVMGRRGTPPPPAAANKRQSQVFRSIQWAVCCGAPVSARGDGEGRGDIDVGRRQSVEQIKRSFGVSGVRRIVVAVRSYRLRRAQLAGDA